MATNVPDIVDRLFRFSVRIVRMASAMPRSIASEVIARQVLRAGTGIGANVEEAQAASTKREFVRKMEIAQSEARETSYWLRLISETGLVAPRRLSGLLNEADELVRVLTTIAKRARGA